MEKLIFGAFDFVASNKWLQYVLLAILIIGTLGGYLLVRDNGVRQKERDRWLKKQADEAVKVANARTKIQEARTNEVQHAEQVAADHVVTGTVAELRDRDPGLATIVYGSPRGGGS